MHIQRVCARIQEQRKARQEAEAKQREEDLENSDEESDDEEEEGDIKGEPLVCVEMYLKHVMESVPVYKIPNGSFLQENISYL